MYNDVENMKDLYSRMVGMYIPSFFCMKIDSQSFGNDMSDRELSLFVHEYIHFIQNITTLHGLERLNSDFAVLINMINWIKSHKDSTIEIPLTDNILSEITINNRRISDLTWGESDDIRKINIVDVSNDSEYSIPIDKDRIVESILITYKQEDSVDEDFCSFGARDVYEGMAYLIEQHITKDYEPSPDIPYCTASKVAEFIYPELVKDYRNILVICDKALMSSNPGVEFVELVKWIKSKNYVPNTPDDLYVLLDQNWGTYDLDQKIDWLTAFTQYAKMVRANMHLVLEGNYFNDYHRWIDFIIDFAIDLRTNEPMFLLNIVNMGNVKENTYFQAFLHNAESPLIETVKHEYFVVNPEKCDSTCLVYFKVFNQIFKLLTKGEVQCSLIPWCNDSRNNVEIDSTCHECPWKHPVKDSQLCTFKGIWQHWGLNCVDMIKK